MKLTLNRSTFSKIFNTVSSICPNKSPKPIVQNVKMDVSDRIELTATDFELTITHKLPDTGIFEPGVLLIPARKMSEILREVRDETIELSTSKTNLRVKSGRSVFELPLPDPDEFPTEFEADWSFTNSMPASELAKLSRRTSFATDPESSRYALGGVLFQVEESKLTCVSTDSRRLAIASASLTESDHTGFTSRSVVIPSKTMALLERAVPDGQHACQFLANDSRAFFRVGDLTVTTLLVEGRFPRYQDVVPKGHSFSIDLPVAGFMQAMRQAMIVTNEESRGVDFKFEGGNLILASQAAETGKSEIVVPIGDDRINAIHRFDPRFIVDFLKVLPAESTVTFRLLDQESPAMFVADDNYSYVVMGLSRE